MSRPTFDDDAELDAIAATVRPVVDAGQARALALKIVGLLLAALTPQGALFSDYVARALASLAAWHTEALAASPAGLVTVAGVADKLASRFHARPMTRETWILHDLAQALRRACECSAIPRDDVAALMLCVADPEVRAIVTDAIRDTGQIIAAGKALAAQQGIDPATIGAGLPTSADMTWRVLQAMPHPAKDRHNHTATVLLPLVIREARRVVASAKLDPAPIEAAIAARTGRPS